MSIQIQKDEVLRYLNYKGQEIDYITNHLINESIKEIEDIITPKFTYREFGLVNRGEIIYLDGSKFSLEGHSIRKHLKNSERCILIAFTLGHQVDRLIRYYEKSNMTKAIILDACASTAIEEFADNICRDLEKTYRKYGEKLTGRFSPGYGDLDIGIQGAFLDLLDARKSMGLTVSSHSILIPRKSVTAIIGIIHKDIIHKERACKDCYKYGDCNFIKGDDGRGN